MTAPKEQAGALAGFLSQPRTPHRRLATAGLAGLLEYLGNKVFVPMLWDGCGNRLRDGHSCRLSLEAASCRAIPCADRCYERIGSPPFVLPSAFAGRFGSRLRRVGGAARQAVCTIEHGAKCSAQCAESTFTLHARRHGDKQQQCMSDDTMRCTRACGELTVIMAAFSPRPDAQCRSYRMHGQAQNTGYQTTPDEWCLTGTIRRIEVADIATRRAAGNTASIGTPSICT